MTIDEFTNTLRDLAKKYCTNIVNNEKPGSTTQSHASNLIYFSTTFDGMKPESIILLITFLEEKNEVFQNMFLGLLKVGESHPLDFSENLKKLLAIVKNKPIDLTVDLTIKTPVVIKQNQAHVPSPNVPIKNKVRSPSPATKVTTCGMPLKLSYFSSESPQVHDVPFSNQIKEFPRNQKKEKADTFFNLPIEAKNLTTDCTNVTEADSDPVPRKAPDQNNFKFGFKNNF